MKLTAEMYAQGDAFQQEKRTVFATEWLPMCMGAQIAKAGDFVSNSIGGWPLFAARDAQGAVRVFRNVCRHQQMQVVEKPSGTCENFRCRYHGWTYDHAGRFVTAPPTVAPADPGSPDNNLPALPVRESHGIVLYNLDAAAGEPSIDVIAAAFAARFGDATPQHGGAVTTEIGCNWKTYLEHALTDDTAQWQWPLLVVRNVGDALVVDQIVPRTFLRTRVVSNVIGRAGDDPAAVLAHVKDAAEQTKAATEALQAARAEGQMPASEGRAGQLHERVLAAYARSE